MSCPNAVVPSTQFQLSEPVKNFNFIILRIGVNPSSVNVISGADCEDIILSTDRLGYYYGVSHGRMVVFNTFNTTLQLGSSANHADFTSLGFSIHGVSRKRII